MFYVDWELKGQKNFSVGIILIRGRVTGNKQLGTICRLS